MAWLEKKEGWIPATKKGAPRKRQVEKSYSIAEVAELLSVTKQTIFKWMAFEEPEDAVIPPSGWYRLPSGHIRIREWVVLKLQAEEN
ncbi:MAG: hypothetical protein JRJ85_01465 [Deltaproteobacteria bacterium]|nr:hypothetical protein [Deltaproteobacteria bacterium]